MIQRPKPVEGFEELLFTTKFGTPINTQTKNGTTVFRARHFADDYGFVYPCVKGTFYGRNVTS